MCSRRKSRTMGKPGRLAMSLGWTAGALMWGVFMLQAMRTGTNAPGWPVYVLLTAGSALCAVCWLVGWLRYDKTHQTESNQDIEEEHDYER